MNKLLELCVAARRDSVQEAASVALKDRYGINDSLSPFMFAETVIRAASVEFSIGKKENAALILYLVDLCNWEDAKRYPFQAEELLIETIRAVVTGELHKPGMEEGLERCSSIIAREDLYFIGGEEFEERSVSMIANISDEAKEVADEMGITTDDLHSTRDTLSDSFRFIGPDFTANSLRFLMTVVPSEVLFCISTTDPSYYSAEEIHLQPGLIEFLRFFRPEETGEAVAYEDILMISKAFFERTPVDGYLSFFLHIEEGVQYMLHTLFHIVLYSSAFEKSRDVFATALAESIFGTPGIYQDVISVADEKSAHLGMWRDEDGNLPSKPWLAGRTLREIMEESSCPELVSYLPVGAKSANTD